MTRLQDINPEALAADTAARGAVVGAAGGAEESTMTIADQIREDINTLTTVPGSAESILDGWIDHIRELEASASREDSEDAHMLEDARLALAAEPAPLHRVLRYLANHPGMQGDA